MKLHDRIVREYIRKDYYADPKCIFHKLAWDDKKSCVDLNGTWTLKTDIGTSVSFTLKLRKLGHRVGRSTIRDLLKLEGLPPAPERSRRSISWRTMCRRYQ